MFAKEGIYEPAGLFSFGHLILLVFFSILGTLFYLKARNWNKEKFINFLKVFSLVIVALEIFKIVWNLANYPLSPETLNRVIPLYYCSIYIFSLLLFSWNKSFLRKISAIWLVYGGLIAGICFLVYPSSSLLEYPFFHFLSLHSMFFHTSLVVVTLLILKHEYYTPKFKDYGLFLVFSSFFMVLAFIVNKISDTNMMFLETPLAIGPFLWLFSQNAIVFQIIMFSAQLFLPFIFTHWIFLLIGKITKFNIYKE